jgi:CspA family cold shock protein
MSKGTVKFFNDSKGFGFIKDAESGKEYFVHVSGLNDEIKENDEVTFDLQEGKKGLNAVKFKYY